MEFAILLFSIVVNGGLGFFVLIRNPKSATHRLFAALSAFIVLWSIANYISLHPPTPSSALFWIRLVLFFAAPLSMTLFIFLHTFPSPVLRIERKMLAFLVFLTVSTMGVAISPYLFTHLRIAPDGSFQPQPGPGMALFILVGIGSIIAAMIVLVKRFFASSGIVRIQLRYLVFGIGIFWGLIIGTIFIPVVFFGYTKLVAFSPLWSLTFFGATAYAIVRHRFLGIRVVATVAFIIVLFSLLFFRFLISQNAEEYVVNGFTLFGAALIGYFLARSVLREVALREKLAAANVELRKLDEAKTEFLSIASHQLRTPLAATKGFLSMLGEGAYGPVAQKQREVLEKVVVSNDRLVRLIEDLLNLSRIELGKMEYRKAPSDFRAIVLSIVEELLPLAERKALALRATTPESVVRISCDAEKIRQAITNLVENAIKYTDRGEVSVTLTQNGGSIALNVRDTGRGIAAEEIPNLFRRFRRGTHSDGDPQGSGLGLYFANEVVKAHGGRIEIHSDGHGRGSEFRVVLPTQNDRSANGVKGDKSDN